MKLVPTFLVAALLCFSAHATAFLPDDANQYERAQAQTVLVLAGEGSGSGVVIERRFNGVTHVFAWTAAHVVDGITNVTVKRVLRHNGEKAGEMSFSASVVARFPKVDAALLRVVAPPDAFEAAVIATNTPLRVGHPIFHVGNLYGPRFDTSLSVGIIAQVGVSPEIPGWPWRIVDQCTAVMVPGSSGGPIFCDKTGDVVGLVVGGPTRGLDGIACFIPIREIEREAPEYVWALRGDDCPPAALTVDE
jgi:S1-C subfamily serine protease